MVHDTDMGEVFERFDGNPIITAESFPQTVNAVLNPGATTFDGETLLLVRVEDRTGLSRLVVARSRDGYTEWVIEPDRGLVPDPDRFEEHWGIEDPRITKIGDDYLIVYTGFSQGGPLVCLAATKDFVTFERRGVLHPPEDKDAALFPERFGDRWALLHRPAPAMSGLGNHIWISWSPDLRYWGDTSILLPARRGSWWDANKVGLGPPPLLTDRGWLLCYHGVRTTASGSIYRLGLALLDRDDPSKVVARGREWVFGPRSPYECSGDVPGVVFPCGWVLENDGDTVRMYYGGADTVVGVATASVRTLIEHLDRHPSSEIV
ncbi:MAG: glycosidase [Actinomycetota bacterium]|nr:glycosidase [Actinomycetota bacterium]